MFKIIEKISIEIHLKTPLLLISHMKIDIIFTIQLLFDIFVDEIRFRRQFNHI